MNRHFSFGFIALLLLLATAGVVAVASQWQKTMLLRGELERVRSDAEELEKLRAENRRWKENQIPAAELESLRADHAAVVRLRAELEALQKKQPPPSAR